MVKQKKAGTPPDDKELRINFKDYLQGQNLVVLSLNVFQGMTQNQLNASIQTLNAISTAMNRVQSATKSALAKNGYDSFPEGLDGPQYKEIAELLSKEATTLGSGITLPAAATAAVAEVVIDGVKPRKKRAKKPKDPNAPKKPQTAYFLYLESNRDRLKEKFPDLKAGEIQNKATEAWNSMAEDEREIYKAQYRKNFEDYKGKLASYQASGGQIAADDLKPVDDIAVLDPAVVAVAAEDSGSDSEESAPPPPPKGKGKKGAAAVKDTKATKAKVDAPKAPTPKKKKGAKEDSPEEKRKAAGDDAANKKKRKSEGTADADKSAKKKRKSYQGTTDF